MALTGGINSDGSTHTQGGLLRPGYFMSMGLPGACVYVGGRSSGLRRSVKGVHGQGGPSFNGLRGSRMDTVLIILAYTALAAIGCAGYFALACVVGRFMAMNDVMWDEVTGKPRWDLYPCTCPKCRALADGLTIEQAQRLEALGDGAGMHPAGAVEEQEN